MSKLIINNLQNELKDAIQDKKPKTAEEKAKSLRKRAFLPPTPVEIPYKPFDPLLAYTITGIPSNMDDDEEREKIFQWCRFWTEKHYLIPTLIEVFAKFPIIGFSHTCQDQEVADYYNTYADNIGLMDTIIQIGMEYWGMGNAVVSGQWSDDMKCWVGEDIIPIENIIVKVSPITKTRRLFLKVTKEMTDLYGDHSEDGILFREELEQSMPDIIPFIKEKKDIPLDTDATTLLKVGGVKDWRAYGTPILTRIFSQLEQETKLDRAKKAVSDRLYAPLVLAKVGASGQAMGGDEGPWIPTDADLNAVQQTIESALLSDLRVIVSHFGLDIEAVNLTGQDNSDNMTEDYTRIENDIYQALGINKDLIAGGSGGQAYASSAIAADFLIQRFISYQNCIRDWLVNDRYRRIAEENEFYVTDKKGTPEKEKVLVQQEDGSVEVEERNKLLVPEIIMKNMDMRTDETQRTFIKELHANGVPISDQYMMGFTRGQDIDFETEMKISLEENVAKAIQQATTKQKIQEAIKKAGLEEFYEPNENVNTPGMQIVPLNGNVREVVGETDQLKSQRPAESDEQKKNAPKAPDDGVKEDKPETKKEGK